MSQTTTLPLYKSAFIDPASPGSRIAGQASQNIGFTRDTRLLMYFTQIRDGSARFRPIVSVTVFFYGTSVTFNRQAFSAFGISDDDFSVNSVSYNSKPALSEEIPAEIWVFKNNYFGTLLGKGLSAAEQSRLGAEFLRAPTVWPTGYLWGIDANCVVDLQTNAPYLSVVYGDNDLHGTLIGTSFTSGYVNPHKKNWFKCSIINGNELSCIADLAPVSAAPTFYWRSQGATTWNQITSSYSYEVPVAANTFPVGTIEWKMTCTDATGTLLESAVYTVSTTDSLSAATQLTPSTTVEDGSAPIVFSWTVDSPTGTAPTGADLQYSLNNGSTWNTLATISGEATTYTAAANTFSAGDILWRVRVKNADGVAGNWSQASFVCMAAPAAPAINTDALPFATISWQATGQQAYELIIDGESLGVTFGSEKQRTLQKPLFDGTHRTEVRVQNVYGLWSPFGAITFSVENDPGETITLDGDFSIDAALSWETNQSTADFLIFRDEALIGHTAGSRFVDRFVLGEHSYYVINRLPSGNYSRSNTVTGRLCVRRPTVAPIEGGEWITLKYSEKSMPEQRFTWSRMHSLRHIAGAKWPVLEISPYEDLSGTYDAAFLCACDAAAFRALRGKAVIMKSRDGKVVIGALVNVSEVVNAFYLATQFTIEQIHWEDYVDDANG